MSEHAAVAEFSIGSRCQVKAGGLRSLRLQGREGTVVGFNQTRSAVRILFDGFKCPETLHLSYLIPIATAAERVVNAEEFQTNS